MDIDQLRGWAAFMDKAMIASLVVVILAGAALGISTWLSFRFGTAVRIHDEQAAVGRYRAIESQSAQLAQDAATARDRLAALEHETTAARAQATALEREVAVQRERATAFEQAAREANERAARTTREATTVGETARPPNFDAAEIQQRLADLAKRVREAAARPVVAAPDSAAEPQPQPRPQPQPAPLVSALRKHAGTRAAMFVLQPVSDAQDAGAAISASLADAGWAVQTWTWTGVAGIFGVVVLVRDGSDTATNEAASALVEALRSAGFNATKGDWPADWRRYRGTLDGPQAPAPTDAAIRIVIGAKPR